MMSRYCHDFCACPAAYYNLEGRRSQRGLVPLLYMVMHSALYAFCWLPVCFMRGIWRDVARLFPRCV
jgi:hypothetical protein